MSFVFLFLLRGAHALLLFLVQPCFPVSVFRSSSISISASGSPSSEPGSEARVEPIGGPEDQYYTILAPEEGDVLPVESEDPVRAAALEKDENHGEDGVHSQQSLLHQLENEMTLLEVETSASSSSQKLPARKPEGKTPSETPLHAPTGEGPPAITGYWFDLGNINVTGAPDVRKIFPNQSGNDDGYRFTIFGIDTSYANEGRPWRVVFNERFPQPEDKPLAYSAQCSKKYPTNINSVRKQQLLLHFRLSVFWGGGVEEWGWRGGVTDFPLHKKLIFVVLFATLGARGENNCLKGTPCKSVTVNLKGRGGPPDGMLDYDGKDTILWSQSPRKDDYW